MSKIAVMGSAPSSRLLAPFHDPSWEIWSCSPPNHDLPRVDAWFELHNLDRKFIPSNQPWLNKITQHPRVYIAYPDQRLPHGILYPAAEMVEKYGTDFFTSSIAYMLAFAIEQKPEVIGMWGVDMAANEEYNQQRPGCKFFMREARKAGIKVITAAQSDIDVPTPLYGYQEFSPMWAKQKVRKKELQERMAGAEQRKAQAELESNVLRGALDDLQYQFNTWNPTAYGPQLPKGLGRDEFVPGV